MLLNVLRMFEGVFRVRPASVKSSLLGPYTILMNILKNVPNNFPLMFQIS